ncbi:MAG: dihydroneopterin aldolase [Hyphomicrobiales bacterium]
MKDVVSSDPAGRSEDDIRLYRIFIRDLTLNARLGVYDREKAASQRIVVNIDLTVALPSVLLEDDLRQVVCYETIVNKVKAMVARRHIHLAETLAGQIVNLCLEDSRVFSARVRVEKPDAIAKARSVGVEIERLSRNRA